MTPANRPRPRLALIVALLGLAACSGGEETSATTSGFSSGMSATDPTSTTATSTSMTATEGTDSATSTGTTGAGTTTEGTGPTTGDATSASATDATTGSPGATDTATATGTDSDTDTGTTGGGDFCEGGGGLQVPGDDTCTGDIGKKTFLFAACSCGDVTINNKLLTDSFEMGGGSVGTNGAYKATSQVDIEGSLWASGAISSFNSHSVSEHLQCKSTVSASGTAAVGGDAYVEDDISAPNKSLTIDGDLHIPAGKTHDAVVNGAVIVENVAVKTPCDCEDPLDIPGIIDAFAGVSDNQEMGVDPDVLKNTAMATTVDLPCGIYVLNEITANAAATLNILGRVVVVVPGDIQASGPFTVNIAEKAELDLFVGGAAYFANTIELGDPARPSATRAYFHGQTTFAGAFDVGANIYMPNAAFKANNAVEMWGALFVGSLDVAGPLTIHYDEDILDLEGCDEPGEQCGDCHDCVNPTPACVDGECGPCQTSADCCPPLQCVEGVCETIIPG
ncbi:MAG: hypothetical protein KC486_03900 [Myxococcales bacterium]|nr:hypothetical protein [Myxococcales bacterium]